MKEFPNPLVDADQPPMFGGSPGEHGSRSSNTRESVQPGDLPDVHGLRLNLGCGRNKLQNMINVDLPINDPDVVLDINGSPLRDWYVAFGKETVAYAQLIHVIEHIPNHLQMMENLWHVMEPGGIVYIRCPHGASDDAWEDPTHVRPIYPGSFMYYSQPTYWRADYGYRGDFRVQKCVCIMAMPGMTKNPNYLTMSRNAVAEMVVTLECVKPIREPNRDLMEQIKVTMAER